MNQISSLWRKASSLAAAGLLAAAFTTTTGLAAQTRVTVGVTETVSSYNPHGDSISLGYGIWCEVYGCLVVYDFENGDYVGMLAESWEVNPENHNEWTFRLKKGLKRHHDGHELTAEDVVHSLRRTGTDPQTRQKQNVKHLKNVVAVDEYTVKLITHQPTATLLDVINLVMITGKDLFDKHGARTADRRYPWGWGPYSLERIDIGQRIILKKVPDHPDAKAENPHELIFQVMREPEQRVTALLNDEIQIAQFIPPHLAPRVEAASNARIVGTSSVEIMFLAMNVTKKPWDNLDLRRAVCHAIDRDLIIKAILKGQALRLDGPIGPGQYGYDPKAAAEMHIPYDPEKARALVRKAGLEGAAIELFTPVGRYVNDKQVTEAMIPMLNAVGLKARLATPEWPTLWANVQKGNTPFYYMGRGSLVDASRGMEQYFETGGSPRVGISDPEIDRLLQKERSTFVPEARKKALNEAYKAIVGKAPACFMWRHKLLYGISNAVEHTPSPIGRVFGKDIAVKGR